MCGTVSAQPEFGEIRKLVVLRDQVRRKMAVVIEDRLRLRETMIQLARLLRAQEKIFVDERLGHGIGGARSG